MLPDRQHHSPSGAKVQIWSFHLVNVGLTHGVVNKLTVQIWRPVKASEQKLGKLRNE